MTEALARNRSDHIRLPVPRATPSLVRGDKAFSTNSNSSTLFTLKIILLSVVAKSIKFWLSLPIFTPAFKIVVMAVCAPEPAGTSPQAGATPAPPEVST